jgi:hypothetical protein
MNKFEALAQFQSWPPEWQRLCAEYWIETGEVEDRPAVASAVSNVAQVWCHADQVELAKKLLEPVATLAHESVSARLVQDKAAKVALPMPGEPFPHNQTREIRRAVRAKNMNPLKPWSIADDETLVKLHDTGIRRSEIIMRFMADHPYRTFNAVASRHDHLRRLDWKVQ